jgi:PAS domain S-box-containing protein
MEQMDNKADILLVDDRPDGLLALEALLSENENYRLVKASSGLEAYNLLGMYDFAVILMDVQMPGLDGFETTELIRKNPDFAKIPIIFVTAINKDDRYVYRGYESGAVDYIFKPFDPFILTSKVSVFVNLHLQKRIVRLQAAELRTKEDLEHRSRMQTAEIESLRRYRNLADAIPHLVWKSDCSGKMEYCNDLWLKYTGQPFENSLGEGWKRSFDPFDLQMFLQTWAQSQESGESFEIEARLRSAQGEYRWHLIRGVPEKDTDHKVMAWLGTCTDIHDRKASEQRLIEAQKAAETASKAKTQFLANMSHEIRTPLGAIIGFTELSLDPDLSDEEKTNNLSIVRRNSYQLLKVIDEILDISKVEAGRMQIERVETDLIDVLSNLRSLLNVNAINKGIQLSFHIQKQIPDRVLTDVTRLRQILTNVVGNAIKFTHQGEVSVTAQYDYAGALENSVLRFEVKDTGIGLEADVAQKLFTPFSQADSSTTRLYGGTGLGLALARQLARALGGDVFLKESEPGVGSTFVIEIQAEPMEDSKWVKGFSVLGLEENVIPMRNLNSDLSGAKILLIEDAEDNQVLISQLLKQSGARIDIANNGKDGIEKAMANHYNVILMDIQMPQLDGYEATSRLRKAGYQQPIIALTAHALKEERELALRTGCNGHLTKPIDRRELIEGIKKFMKPVRPSDLPQKDLH